MTEENADKRKQDCATWKATMDKLHSFLSECASKALQLSLLTKDQTLKYNMSGNAI